MPNANSSFTARHPALFGCLIAAAAVILVFGVAAVFGVFGHDEEGESFLGQAEARVARLEEKLAECEAQMADPVVYSDAGKVADLGRTQMQLRAELEQAEAELLALYG